MKKFVFILSIFSINFCFAQFEDKDIEINKYVHGTLCLSTEETDIAAVIIPGSGPADRDGNSPAFNNHCLEMLAHGLAKNNIASFRYDRRLLRLKELQLTTANLSFDDFIEDAITAVNYLKNSLNYKKIVVIGHSQGSLVGMIAAKDRASGFISIAGPANKISEKIAAQLSKKSPELANTTRAKFKELRETDTIKQIEPFLTGIFRPSFLQFLNPLRYLYQYG